MIDELIDWSNIPEDPIFQLTFPQKGMSTNPGKIQILGMNEINQQKVFTLRFIQGRQSKQLQRFYYLASNILLKTINQCFRRLTLQDSCPVSIPYL